MPEIDPDALAAVRRAREMAKQWSDLATMLMEQIKQEVGDEETGTVGGRPVVRHSTREVTRVDSKSLRADLPVEVLAPYLKTTVEHRYELLED